MAAVIVTTGAAMAEIIRAVTTKAMVAITVISTIRTVAEVGTKVMIGETITLVEMVATVATIGTVAATTPGMATREVVINEATVARIAITTVEEMTTAVGMITGIEMVDLDHVTEWIEVPVEWTLTGALGMDWTVLAAVVVVVAAIVAIREIITGWVTKTSN